jgi:hypothetical protein
MVALLGLLGIVGCHVVLGLDGPEGSEPLPFQPRPGDGGADVAPEATLPKDPCAPGAPPAVPDQDDEATAKLAPLYFVLRDQSFTRPDGGLAGIDVDRFRTCAAQDTWAKSSASCVSKTGDASCDLTSCGEDNGLGALAQATGANLLASNDIEMERGSGALLIYLDDYNGKLNDRSVRVGFARGIGITADLGCDGLPRGLSSSSNSNRLFDKDGGAALPIFPSAHDGCDRWLLSREEVTIVQGAPAPLRLSTAYVNDGVLVMREAVIAPFGTGSTSIDVAAPFLQARLVVDGDAGVNSRFRLTDLVIAGRMPVAQLIPSFGTFTGPGGLLCKNKETYVNVARELCRAADVASGPAFDGQGTNCDSLSVGVFARQATPVLPTVGPDNIEVRTFETCAKEDLLGSDFCSKL